MDIATTDAGEKPFTVGQWIITLLLIYLPPVNLIFLFYWAFSKKGSVNRKNFSIASLIIGGANFILFLALYFRLVWPMVMIEN
ncbi:MAG: hypothetical protein AB1598_06330 [Thermodesulfobacteriota bacterium]